MLQFILTQLALLPSILLSTPFRTWCRTDPSVMIGGRRYNVKAAVNAGDQEVSLLDNPRFIFFHGVESFELIEAGTFDGEANIVTNTPSGLTPKVRVIFQTSQPNLTVEIRVNNALKATHVTNEQFDVDLD
jgi:hypothetical protein